MSEQEIKKTYAVVASPLNKHLISQLTENAEEILIFPAVKTAETGLPEEILDRLSEPGNFDWLILTDVFAADYFIETLRRRERDFFELDNLTVCVLGEAVADRLRFVQVHADVIPHNVTDETVFSTIKQYAGEINNLRFLVLRDDSGSSGLAEKLRSEDASVEETAVYSAEFDDAADAARLKALLTGGAVDEFVFSSAEDVATLKHLFKTSDLKPLMSEVKIAAVNEIAFQTLQENGLRPLYFHYK